MYILESRHLSVVLQGNLLLKTLVMPGSLVTDHSPVSYMTPSRLLPQCRQTHYSLRTSFENSSGTTASGRRIERSPVFCPVLNLPSCSVRRVGHSSCWSQSVNLGGASFLSHLATFRIHTNFSLNAFGSHWIGL